MQHRLVLLLAGVALLGACSAGPVGLVVGEWGDFPIRALCIEGTEQYEDVAAELDLTPFQNRLRDLFKQSYHEKTITRVVDSGCDATIRVDVAGSPQSELYMGAGTLFTGATVEGSLTLSASGQRTLTGEFHAYQVPGDQYTTTPGADLPDEPSEAPFFGTARDDVCGILAGWFQGPDLATLLFHLIGHRPIYQGECGDYGVTTTSRADG